MSLALLRRRIRATPSAPVVADVPLQLVRVASGTASTVLTGSVPLAPGDLPAGGVCALYIGGAEVTANIATVGRPHADGSARAVRVQHTRSMTNGSDVAAVLKLGTAQTLSTSYSANSFNSTTQPAWQTQVLVNGAVISTDSARTCASGILGRLSPKPVSIPGTPSWLATIETRWDSTHNARVSQYAGDVENGAYGQYDPVYQNMVRSARATSVADCVSAYLQALALYGLRRNVYWITASPYFGVPEYLIHQQGMAAMALLLDDTTVREGHLTRCTTTSLYTSEDGFAWINSVISNSVVGDARTIASTIWMLIACDRMGDGLNVYNSRTIREWVRQWALRAITRPQWVTEATGQVSYKSETDTLGNTGSGVPAWSNNFQNALLCDALATVLDDNYVTDSTERASITARITECMEWMWQTQWFAEGTVSSTFPSGAPSSYQVLSSRAVTGYSTGVYPEPAVDVGGLWLGPLMWLAENVNRSTWQTRADVVFDVIGRSPMNGANAPNIDPSLTTNQPGKVTNETFFYMGRALARRV